jgi:pyruvate-ferredoxin/flavodoxin oxidoreductase
MQSEGGAAGAVHGILQAGSLSSTYTASQGLLLMIPNIYKMKGELLPAVFHVPARALASRALSIFGDHSDINAARQTGAVMLCSHSVQEAMDLAGAAHAIAINSSVPVIHFYDGFRTSSELQKIEVFSEEEAKSLLDESMVKAFRQRALTPSNPVTRGGAENDDIFFQGVEAQNTHYNKSVDMAEDILAKISKITGREYAPFTYYGSDKADRVIVAMGSVTETVKETIDDLNRSGEKVGIVKVHLYRPFSMNRFANALPDTVKKIGVLDRTKEPGSSGEPLYLDVVAALKDTDIKVVGGRYGLASKNTAPRHIKSVFDNLKGNNPKNGFTVGINDDVTNLSLS